MPFNWREKKNKLNISGTWKVFSHIILFFKMKTFLWQSFCIFRRFINNMNILIFKIAFLLHKWHILIIRKKMFESESIVGAAASTAACRNLDPWSGTEPACPAVVMQSPSHWTVREVPELLVNFYACASLLKLLSRLLWNGTNTVIL